MLTTAEIRKRAKKVKAVERKKQLLQTAITLTAKKGVGQVGHNDLAKVEKISTATVFAYFSNRDELNREILDAVGDFVLSSLNDDHLGSFKAEDKVKKLAVMTIDTIHNNLDYAKIWVMWSSQFDTNIRNHFKIYESQFVDQLSNLLKQALNNTLSDEQISDRAQVMLASSAHLVRMSADNVPYAQRLKFLEHFVSIALS